MHFMESLGVTPSLDTNSLGGTDAERERSLMQFMESLGVTPSLDTDSLGGTDAERERSLEFLRSSLRLSPMTEEARVATTGGSESGSALLGVTDEEAQRSSALLGVTDEESQRYLRLVHQRLAHASLRYIKQLRRSDDIMTPFDVSEAHFDCCQFYCPKCARTRQTRKPTATNRRKPPAALRVLQQVVVDVEEPRRVPSLHYYKGDKGNQSAAWQERCDIANLANAGGVSVREDLQPFWEGCMMATFESREPEPEPEPGGAEPEKGEGVSGIMVDEVESALGCVHALATEFAQWSRIEDNGGALVELYTFDVQALARASG